MIFYSVFLVIAFLFSTTSLALALWIIGEEDTDPFKTDGFKPTMLKCIGICAITTALSLVPFGRLVGSVIWFIAVMALFEKSVFGAVLIAISGAVISGLMAVVVFVPLSRFFVLP